MGIQGTNVPQYSQVFALWHEESIQFHIEVCSVVVEVDHIEFRF